MLKDLRTIVRTTFPPWTRRGIWFRRSFRRPVLADPTTVWPFHASRHKEVMFVQIGSHNGVDGDPLARWIDSNPRWHGIMVEPVPQQFERLSRLRGDDPRIRFVRAAITDHDGTVEMNIVNGSVAERMLSSIHADLVHQGGSRASQIRRVSVPSMTLRSLIEGALPIGVLHIDAEGHDAVIVDQVDFMRLRPAVVMFESEHLSAEDRERCEARLRGAGYRVVSDSLDTLGILAG